LAMATTVFVVPKSTPIEVRFRIVGLVTVLPAPRSARRHYSPALRS
jgi:hypothetical protein